MITEIDAVLDVFEAETFPAALEILQSNPSISLVLMDLSMPGGKWHQVVKNIRSAYPNLRIVIVSASDDVSSVCDAIKLGVHGFIPKTSTGKVMVDAICLVLDGGTYLPPVLLTRNADDGGLEPSLIGRHSGPSTLEFNITPRQGQVLEQLRLGMSNKEIARNLNIAEGTVKLHVTSLLHSFNVNNRTQVVIEAQKAKIPFDNEH
jgi:DNA-binding NarL/FixJ family response regulator